MVTAPTYSLEPFRGEWKKEDLLHLLRRCLFGIGPRELNHFKGLSLNQCIDILLTQSPAPKPLTQEDPDLVDPFVKWGGDWTNAPYEDDYIDSRRKFAIKGWWAGAIIKRDFSLTEKMRLFWHTHFVTELDVVKDSRYSYRYISLLREHALGNYRKLVREGTTNIAMLVYLNGNSNSKEAPNENYSRELMELFTLGKGYGVNYTEDDVRAGARVLSGWRDNKDTIRSDFHPELHDTGDKQFSSFFDNTVIKGREGGEGIIEVDELVDMIFKKLETAEFLCRNLYRWFVCPHMDENIEQKIIQPLAEQLVAHNFEVSSVLRTLLSSEHFFDAAFRGCIIKSPADFFLGAMQQYDVEFPKDVLQMHLSWIQLHAITEGLTMNLGNPPSVAGWPAYYQAPKYNQWWVNSATLGYRMSLVDTFSSPEGVACNGPVIRFDFLPLVSQFERPENAVNLIEEAIQLLCAVPVTDAAKSKLKTVLLSGLQTDHYWTDAWNKYVAKKDDSMAKSVIDTRLRALFIKIMHLPEFQMM